MIKIVDNFGEHFDWNCIPFEKRGSPQKMSLFVRFNSNLGYMKRPNFCLLEILPGTGTYEMCSSFV